MDKMKKGFLALAAVGVLAVFSANASSALPVNKAAGIATSSADIQQVGWGWRHRGWHRGWYGHRWGGYHRWHRHW
jgi:hypothetical protein